MNYPVWEVPHMGGMWVIGAIAIFHVMISHFAIGGGFYLPMAEARALRLKREDLMEVVRAHSKFFLILTAVFGTTTGVAIWFAIGLASPEATSTLIHNFVFGWAIEWVFFLLEISAAALYYYTWGRIPDELHLKVGKFYAAASFFTLVIINGILTFMLTPGETWLSVAGTGHEASKFWNAFFNPTYWPSLFLRILVCTSLAGVWALVTSSRIDGDLKPALKTDVVRWSAKWLIPAFVLMPALFLWYLYMIPEAQRGLLQLGVSTIGAGTFTQITRGVLVTTMTSATIVAVVYLFAYRHPREFSFGQAACIMFLAAAATASTEQTREMLRKPYVICERMYSNGIRKGQSLAFRDAKSPSLATATKISEIDQYRTEGYLAHSPWVSKADRAAWAMADDRLTTSTLAAVLASHEVPDQATLRRGELMMRGQCFACHTVGGYRSLRILLKERDRASIDNILVMLCEQKEDSPYRKFMPPLVGTPNEIAALAAYLDTLNHPVKPDGKPASQVALAAGTH